MLLGSMTEKGWETLVSYENLKEDSKYSIVLNQCLA